MRTTGIGGSLFLVALGAIFYWAISVEAEGFSINTIGLILMIVGGVGLLLSVFMSASADQAQRESGGVTVVERD
jgi:hypothetical protein